MDETLVRAARSGDRGALNALCEALYPPLRRFFFGLGGAAHADDLTQETLLRLLERLPDYRPLPGARFEGWVFRIAYRLFLDDRRRRRPAQLIERECADTAAGPEEALVEREAATRLRRAVERLPDEQRAMVTMRYQLDMGYRDIARALGVAAPRVKWRLHDALKKLESALEEVRSG